MLYCSLSLNCDIPLLHVFMKHIFSHRKGNKSSTKLVNAAYVTVYYDTAYVTVY